MRESTIDALDYINRQGLDYSMWNVEKYPVGARYYFNTEENEIPAHVAIYAEDAVEAAYIRKYADPDDVLHDRDGDQLILVYYLY